MTANMPCQPDELRSLFLFEALTDEQLAVLCSQGHIEDYQPGPICVEGEPATCFYVMISGELMMSKLSGGQDIETNRTSQRGVYCGAWRAFTGGKQKNYDASVHVTKPSRFFVMDAPVFAQFMRDQFPMAVHLLDGIAVGTDRTRRIIDNREKLLALGRLSAGLTHQLNNPAAAISRAASDLRERVANMRHKLAMLADGTVSPEALSALVRLQDRVAEQVAKVASQHLSAIETSDREDAVGDWLDDHGIDGGWDIAPTFVEGGIDTDWLERISTVTEELASTSLEQAIRWINYTIEGELLMNQILEASKRISALVADAKQYSQMDRAPFQVTNVHDLLYSTLVMFADRLTKDTDKDSKAINVVKDIDKSLPEIPCYPADLNQVWTNIIDNAIAAMRDTGGTLTVRTCRYGENMARVEICDTGPGIPAEIREHIFEPFFTTKPFGEGTGLGLDLAFNIVVKKHHGDLRVESKPGDTRFIVLLPLQRPAAADVAATDDDIEEADSQ
ncbi:ATP-binding protein [Mycobacterium montefiorense]|uniref:histidine kinase n=1 Tax=Mycobacterium montefiorense TaxID=154654 RepID=A0AA37PP65_9MYCO|nr:ATP-binding protein [Mycobacterium montefiorense]GBG36902.1 histidine kinase [Mycobacterium montefiorense]GKU37808.1 histidine kinase [Mycobacterium montefiorense]GKU42767.1 histidine kinase [Mycobacterium montefiorense]GKU46356.1 histidine kinase [Mycobacterium montefiorense]GKU51060.1 histidine kinase [Mycobacterium montefiorense]